MIALVLFLICLGGFLTLCRHVARSLLIPGISCLAALALSSPVHAQTIRTYNNSTDSATNGINNTATSCSTRFTRTFSVTGTFTVADVNLGVLASHTYRGDLVMYLVSPNGTRVQLTAGSGSNGAANFNAVFDDEASSSITNYTADDTATATMIVPPFNGSYRPASALSGFDGQSAGGTWTLEICDQYAQDSGTFFHATLFIAENPTNYADLSLATNVSNTAPTAGATISYTLTVNNSASSTQTASGIVVSDVLPAGVAFVSAAGTGTYNTSTGAWSVGSLAPGQSASITLTVTVTASAGATVANYSEVSASSAVDIDSIPGNGSGSEDDDALVSFTVSGSRVAGTAPALICPAGTTLFDWDAVSWSAGATSASYSLGTLGTIGFSIVNPGSFLSNATYGGQSPNRQNVVTGGQSPAQYSLMELVNLGSQNDAVTTTITLPVAVSGAQFRIFDVDFASGQFADKVTVIGKLNGVTVLPVLTNGVTNYVIGNSAYGDSTSADASANGNVTITFSAPIDAIVISYGNHALAPTDPGQQAIALHDFTFCNPATALTVSKTSSVISDPVNGTSNPKAIPGAVMEYCILISNTGTGTANTVVATDPLPANVVYLANSMMSGTSCASANTAEDDNNTGADESDPVGASISGNTMTALASTIAPGTALAFKFRATIQ